MEIARLGRRWLPLNALRAFEGVARHGSFTAAAHALFISQSALSRHVLSLEKLIGTVLFERKPHGLVLTKAGEHLVASVSKSFDRLEHALDDIMNDSAPTQRVLRVQIPPSFAAHHAVTIMRDFRREITDVEIDLVSPYGVGPPATDVDVAVIYSKPTVSESISDLLWPVRLAMLCHPDIWKAHEGKDLAEFIEANEIVHVRINDVPRHHMWSEFVRRAGIRPVKIDRGIVFDTAVLAVEYAASGEGLALVDENLFADHLAEGRLVKPFETTLDDGYGYYLITHPDGLGDTAIAFFRSWLIQRFGTMPAEEKPPAPLRVVQG
ncbi:MAG TPA: LysR family transcriptional regulator [Stellaceae bacterium]|nr:LysR family transcriptional regulator [Stellaceae bacterium]